jgi:probable phosphoglycerate mutase
MRVLLVRHGETAWNRDGRINGWAPVGLTDRGHEQAAAVGDHVAANYEVSALHSSDLRRAVQTAEGVADALGVSPDGVREDGAWRERDFGVYQGLTDEEVRAADPDLIERYRRGEVPADERPPSGESPAEFRERVLDGWATLPATGTRLVVTHNGPIVVVLAAVTGRDVDAAFDAFDVPNGSLTVVEGDRDDAEAVRVGERPT